MQQGDPGHSEARRGRIVLIVGPMWSGKTTELLARVRAAALAGAPAVLIKHASDARYGDGAVVATHGGARQASAGEGADPLLRVVAAAALADVEVVEGVVGVDEGQFFADLPEACDRWASEGRDVFVAALDGDFARRPFGRVGDVLPLCDKVRKRRGVCMACRRRKSVFSQRLGGGAAVVQVGGRESYRAVCRRCHAAPPPGAGAPGPP